MGFVAFLGAWFGTSTIIWQLFDRADKVARPEWKTQLSNWLNRLGHPGEFLRWAESFGSVFDLVFGEKHYSIKRFIRSCVASIISVTIAFALLLAFIDSFNVSVLFETIFENGIFIFYAVLINLIADYISLIETRLIIKIMKNTKSFYKMIMYIILDSFFTLIIFSLFFSLGVIVWAAIFELPTSSSFLIYTMNTSANIIQQFDQVFGILFLIFLTLFLSTYFTTVWSWIYALSAVFIWLCISAKLVWRQLEVKFLDVENKPLHSMAFASIILVGLAYIAGGIWSFLFL